MTTKTFSLKQNAKRSAIKAGLPVEMVYETDAGWAFDLADEPGSVPYAINDGVNSAGEPAVGPAIQEGDEIPAFLKGDRAAQAAALEEVAPTAKAAADGIEAEEMAFAHTFDTFLATAGELFDAGNNHALAEAAFAAGIAAGRAQIKPPRKPRGPRERTGGPSKKEIVAGLLTRPEGCTTRDILNATGWPSVSVPALAKSSNLNLRQEKNGRATRYYGEAA